MWAEYIMHIEASSTHILGDTHGESGLVNKYINKHNPDVLILTGDCAFYWNDRKYSDSAKVTAAFSTDALDRLKPQNTKIFWLRGNHDEVNYLDSHFGRNAEDPVEIKHNVFYCPIGSLLNINGKECLFVGGAASIDADSRIQDIDWWQDEIVTGDDFKYISDTVDKVDVVFSHTVPEEFAVLEPRLSMGNYLVKFNDPSRVFLSNIMHKYTPEYWFAGHWHKYKTGKYKNTEWCTLNTVSPGFEHEGRYALDISGVLTKLI